MVFPVSLGRALAPRGSSITNAQFQICRATPNDPTKCKEKLWNISNIYSKDNHYSVTPLVSWRVYIETSVDHQTVFTRPLSWAPSPTPSLLLLLLSSSPAPAGRSGLSYRASSGRSRPAGRRPRGCCTAAGCPCRACRSRSGGAPPPAPPHTDTANLSWRIFCPGGSFLPVAACPPLWQSRSELGLAP